jgi:hypothetical protein
MGKSDVIRDARMIFDRSRCFARSVNLLEPFFLFSMHQWLAAHLEPPLPGKGGSRIFGTHCSE